MSVDLLLPCIRFEVAIYPNNPNRPTDLEAAALYFIGGEGASGTDFSKLEAFLGLGEAVVADMMIRFINRGWITIHSSRVLFLSEKAKYALEGTEDEHGITLTSTEEGRTFSLCYDLIGGGVAVIHKNFLTKKSEDAKAVPRRIQQSATLDNPYGCPLDGFLTDDTTLSENLKAQILKTLQMDRNARRYFQGAFDQQSFHVSILRPGRRPGLDDVWFYRCAFTVHRARDSDDEELPPLLQCVEKRNRQVRRLGELNADRIVELALSARQAGEVRFWKTLKSSIKNAGSRRHIEGDMLTNLREQMRLARKDAEIDDLKDLWDQLKDRVADLVSNRLDFNASRVIPHRDIRSHIATVLSKAKQRIILSSAVIRSSSPELSGRPGDTLSMLAATLEAPKRPRLLIHGVQPGGGLGGRSLSDEVGIGRLVTALGSSNVHLVSNQQNHMLASFLLCDTSSLSLFTDHLFGERPVGALQLQTCAPAALATYLRSLADLPSELHEREETLPGNERAIARAADSDLWSAAPLEVAVVVKEIGALLAELQEPSEQNPARHTATLEDLEHQVTWLGQWIETKSESVELLTGLRIEDAGWRLIMETGNDEPLFIGIAGWNDSRILTELREAIELRLSRQDRHDGKPARTVICLPEQVEFNDIAARFEEDFRPIPTRATLIRAAPRNGARRPVSFIMSSSKALLAQDGLLMFVPNAGRRVKGTQLGVYLRGPRARALAEAFVHLGWPDNVAALAGQDETTAENAYDWQVTKRRKDELRRQAAGWFADGNRGATAARKAIIDGPDKGNWSRIMVEVDGLLRAGADYNPQLSYSLIKAMAIAESKGEISGANARRRLASLAREQGDLMAMVILADHLPDDSAFHDPSVRKLALCLARRHIPTLTTGEMEQLVKNPSNVTLALACLLMLDGLAGDLPHWLPPTTGGQLSAFTNALVGYFRRRPPRPLDLGHITGSFGRNPLDATIDRLRARLSVEVNRTFQEQTASSVRVMHDLLFRTRSSFPADLWHLVEHLWPTLSTQERHKQMKLLLNGSVSDLKVDLVAAARPDTPSLNPEKLSRKYYDQKNEQILKLSGHEPVRLHLGGRYAVKSLEDILKIVYFDIVPEILGNRIDEEIHLTKATQDMKGITQLATSRDERWLLERVLARLNEPEANMELHSPPWLMPCVLPSSSPDWDAMERAYLAFEFRKGTGLKDVTNWFLRDQPRPGNSQADDSNSENDNLLLLHQLLEHLKNETEPTDLSDAHHALTEKLQQIIAKALRLRQTAEGLCGELQIEYSTQLSLYYERHQIADERKALQSSFSGIIDEVNTLTEQTSEALRDNDPISAILVASELHLSLAKMETIHQSVGIFLREKLYKVDSEAAWAEVRRLLDDRAVDAAAVASVRRYLDLRRYFKPGGRTPDSDIRLDIMAQQDVSPRVPADTVEFVRIISRVLSHDDGPADRTSLRRIDKAQPYEIARAVAQFLLPPDCLDLGSISARLEDGVWRVRADHQAITLFTFDMADTVEFLLPVDWNMETRLREEHKKQYVPPVLPKIPGTFQAIGQNGQSLLRKQQVRPILISFFYTEALPGMPTLPWRKLAELARVEVEDRRISVLTILAGQCINSAEALKEWWKGLVQRESFIVRLLGDGGGELPDIISKALLAKFVRNFCLIFRIGVSAISAEQKLSENCISNLSRIWPQAGSEEYDAAAVLALLDCIVGSASNGPQRQLEMKT